MPKMEIVQDGDTVVSEEVDAATANAMVKSFNDHASNAYAPQEYPKWVDTPKGPSYVASKDDEDELHRVKGNDDFIPSGPVSTGTGAAIVTPTYPGDGYGYVDGMRVSDDRVRMPNVGVPGDTTGAGPMPAKGPARTNAEAALQDVTFTTGDKAEALRDVAQRNKDKLAALAEGDIPVSGVPSPTTTIADASVLGHRPVPQNTPATSSDFVAPRRDPEPDQLGVANGDAVPTSNPKTTETLEEERRLRQDEDVDALAHREDDKSVPLSR